jgi:hypothetical protein
MTNKQLIQLSVSKSLFIATNNPTANPPNIKPFSLGLIWCRLITQTGQKQKSGQHGQPIYRANPIQKANGIITALCFD